MALTFRDTNGAALSYDEMDSNWRFFTGSFTNTGTITATAFAGDGSAITGVTGEWDGSHNGNASITGSLTVTSDITTTNFTASGTITSTSDISSSSNVYGVTGSFLHLLGNGSQLTGVESEWDGSRNGNAEITGSLVVTNDISSSGTLYGNSLNLEGANISYNSTDDILYLADGVKLGLGLGPAPAIPDIALSHNGSDGLIRNSNGNLTIESSADNTVIRNFATGGNIILQSDKSLGGQGGVVLISGSNADVRLDIRGNVTASGNISAIGDLYGNTLNIGDDFNVSSNGTVIKKSGGSITTYTPTLGSATSTNGSTFQCGIFILQQNKITTLRFKVGCKVNSDASEGGYWEFLNTYSNNAGTGPIAVGTKSTVAANFFPAGLDADVSISSTGTGVGQQKVTVDVTGLVGENITWYSSVEEIIMVP